MESKCIKCQKRFPGCAGSCPDYKEYRERLDFIKSEREKARKLREAIDSIESGRYKRGPMKGR